MALNKFIVMGRLVRDPELKHTQNDTAVCKFSIACDRDIVSKQSNERETDFFDITAWRSTAEFVSKYFTKGRMIIIVGRLQRRNYTDKEGIKRTAYDVIADNVYFGDSKKDAEAAGATPSANTTSAPPAQVNNASAPDDEDDDDLPF